jgi:hypothetical protein
VLIPRLCEMAPGARLGNDEELGLFEAFVLCLLRFRFVGVVAHAALFKALSRLAVSVGGIRSCSINSDLSSELRSCAICSVPAGSSTGSGFDRFLRD